VRDKIVVSVTNVKDVVLLYHAYRHLQSRLNNTDLEPIGLALKQLIDNVLEHAYNNRVHIDLKVHFEITETQLNINIEDHGLPFDFSHFLSEPIDHSANHKQGFFLIYDLVDDFSYTPLKEGGKRFSIIKKFTHPLATIKKIENRSVDISYKKLHQYLQLRRFVEGDGDTIAKLIYKNYDYSYYKELFYEPQKIREANQNGHIISLLALYEEKIIGHFALLLSEHSNIAEIGVATVDPDFKRMGVMQRMLQKLIVIAQERKLSAIYGQALTLHPFSQKANLRAGMIESAISLGMVPETMEIEHQIKATHRSGAMIAFKLFEMRNRSLFLPSRYESQLLKVYKRAKLTIKSAIEAPETTPYTPLKTTINTQLNEVTIIIEHSFLRHTFFKHFEEARHQKFDMVYVDINLHTNSNIDTIIAYLNSLCFFYSGLLFDFYHDEDFLRLQYVNSKSVDVDIEEIICYSDDANKMMHYISNDYKSVIQGQL